MLLRTAALRVLPRVVSAGSRAMSSAPSGGAAKLWGGRFTGKTDPLMERFNNSIGFDKRFWRVDIRGSIEYAKALSRAGILTADEAAQIESGLKKVRALPETHPSAGRAPGACTAPSSRRPGICWHPAFHPCVRALRRSL